MRVFAVIATLALSLTMGVVAFGVAAAPSTSILQDATPASEMPAAPEATPEVLVQPTGPVLVDGTPIAGVDDSLTLFRTVVAPGGIVPAHEHLGANLMFVESGAITFTVDTGMAWAWCADGCASGTAPDPTGVDTLFSGTTVELEAGDWVQQRNDTTHGFRNDGEVDAVLLVVSGGAGNGSGACLGAC